MIRKVKFIIFFGALVLIQFSLLGNFDLKSSFISDVIVFLSIIFGFYVTSLAIFATSSYVGSLYKTTDEKNPESTLLHTLLGNYRRSLNLILFSVVYFLIVQFILVEGTKSSLKLTDLIVLPFLGILSLNFFYSCRMLNDLVKVIIQEAKRNSSD